MPSYINRAYFGVSAAPGAGNIAVGSAVAGPYRTLGAAHDGMTFDVAITDGNAWEVRTGCVYTHGTTTLTRGTLEDSSTGSAVSLTASAKVMVTATAAKQAALEGLIGGGGGGGITANAFLARNNGTATQSLPASTFTKLTVITEELDPAGWYDGANQRFQPNVSGVYLVGMGAQVTMGGSANDGTSLIAEIRKNGSPFAHAARGWITKTSVNNGNLGVSGTVVVPLNGTSDYVEPFVWQSDGGARSTVAGAERQFFWGYRIS